MIYLYTIEFFEENEIFPVAEFINTLSTKEKAKILREIELLRAFGFSLGMPYIRKIAGTDELWELRIQCGSNDYRIFYFHYIKGIFILLHAIKKKTDKTPVRDIQMALSRIKKYYQRKEDLQ